MPLTISTNSFAVCFLFMPLLYHFLSTLFLFCSIRSLHSYTSTYFSLQHSLSVSFFLFIGQHSDPYVIAGLAIFLSHKTPDISKFRLIHPLTLNHVHHIFLKAINPLLNETQIIQPSTSPTSSPFTFITLLFINYTYLFNVFTKFNLLCLL